MMLLIIPEIQREGAKAAEVGTHLASKEMPQGFVFCPYPHGSAERNNFIGGAISSYFEGELCDRASS